MENVPGELLHSSCEVKKEAVAEALPRLLRGKCGVGCGGLDETINADLTGRNMWMDFT